MTTSTLVKVESVDIIPIPVSRHSREYQPVFIDLLPRMSTRGPQTKVSLSDQIDQM